MSTAKVRSVLVNGQMVKDMENKRFISKSFRYLISFSDNGIILNIIYENNKKKQSEVIREPEDAWFGPGFPLN